MILNDLVISLLLLPLMLIAFAGNTVFLWAVHQDKSAKIKVSAFMIMIVAASTVFIVDKNVTTVSQAVDNIHQDAEVVEGVIESINFDPDKGITLTVDGVILHVTPHDNAEVHLKDNDRYTYARVKPEVGDTIGYKDYTYRGEDYTYAVSYTKKDQNGGD